MAGENKVSYHTLAVHLGSGPYVRCDTSGRTSTPRFSGRTLFSPLILLFSKQLLSLSKVFLWSPKSK
jgi:hypothetical protein